MNTLKPFLTIILIFALLCGQGMAGVRAIAADIAASVTDSTPTSVSLTALAEVNERVDAVIQYVDDATGNVASTSWSKLPKDVQDGLKGSGKVLSIAIPGGFGAKAIKAAREAKRTHTLRRGATNRLPKDIGLRLSYDASSKSWTTPGGLVYGQGSAHGNRVKHVLAHATPDPTKPVHSVFSGPRNKVLGTVDEAWSRRVGPGTLQSNGNRFWNINMGRTVGTAGQTSVRIVVRDGTNNVITAFPK